MQGLHTKSQSRPRGVVPCPYCSLEVSAGMVWMWVWMERPEFLSICSQSSVWVRPVGCVVLHQGELFVLANKQTNKNRNGKKVWAVPPAMGLINLSFYGLVIWMWVPMWIWWCFIRADLLLQLFSLATLLFFLWPCRNLTSWRPHQTRPKQAREFHSNWWGVMGRWTHNLIKRSLVSVRSWAKEQRGRS